MRTIGFYIVYGILWLLSALPFRVLWIFSNILFFLTYYVIRYRREVVRQNIKHSFPEKSKPGIIAIEKEFYKHFCDSFLEWTYTIHATEAQLKKHMKFENPEVIENLYRQGKSVVAVLGHYANWEWLTILPAYIPYTVWAIHKPLHNKHYNNFINGLRTKFGVKMVDTKNAFRTLLQEDKAGRRTFTYFLADQSPPRTQIQYYTQFLNQDTPVYLGAEVIAKKLNMAVVFLDIRKVKRGYYSIKAKVLFKETRATPEFFITDKHVKTLEKTIIEEPAYWLWSHKRWKHSRDVKK